MRTHVFYKNLQVKDKMYGLELVDLYILIFFFNVSFLVNSNFLCNIILTGILFFALKIYKRNKPRNYTTDLINFWNSKKILTIASRDTVHAYLHKRGT